MDKREFLQQFALARASRVDSFNSNGVLSAGVAMWDAIESKFDTTPDNASLADEDHVEET